MLAWRLFDEAVALLAPPVCVSCLEPLTVAGEQLCFGCRREMPWLLGVLCGRCGLPAPCRPCPAREAAFDRAWAPVAYDGPARDLVLALKLRGALPVANEMAAAISARVPASVLAGATLIPVPLHGTRRRRRGFNQAERLAHALSTRTGLEVAACVRRGGQATRQAGASRTERRAAAGGHDLRVERPVPLVAVLVDDVHTTGATFDACARALRAAGAREVRCVSYARTLPPGGASLLSPRGATHRAG